MAEERVRTDYWQQLGQFLKSRTVEPLGDPGFIGFFLVSILIFGGLGIWVEIIRAILRPVFDPEGILLAINVFYPSVGFAAAAQLHMNKKLPKYLTGLALLMQVVFVGSCIILQLAWNYPVFSLIAETLISIGALWAWWIVNATNQELREDEPDVPSAAGPADPTGSTLSGTLENFTTD